MFFCKGTNFEGAWRNPQTRFTYFSLRARSLVVERPAHNRVVVGSNPSGPITFLHLFLLWISVSYPTPFYSPGIPYILGLVRVVWRHL